MNVAIIYVYPQVSLNLYYPLAKRFADTWKSFPPGAEPYALHVIGNGGQVSGLLRQPFDGIPYLQWQAYGNIGWDIGAFQYAAETIPCDLLVCLGAPVHFHRAGWLDRIVGAYLEHGPALYGCWAYLTPNWHVRTTAFWCPPQLMQSYPSQIGSSRRSRYDFEHGPHSFTRHVLSAGLECLMVSWDGVYPFAQWHDHAPDAAHSLVHDQHIHK